MYKEQISGTSRHTRLYIFLALAAVILFRAVANITGFGAWVFEVLLVASATAAIYVTLRYTMTSFIYAITADSLIITKKMGRRESEALTLPVSRILKISTDVKGADKSNVPGSRRFSFCPSMRPKRQCMITARNEEGLDILVFLECSDDFVKELRRLIRNKNEQ